MAVEELSWHLQEEKNGGLETLIKYGPSGRQVVRWQEVRADPEEPPLAFKDEGVYLITGGLGAQGVCLPKKSWSGRRRRGLCWRGVRH